MSYREEALRRYVENQKKRRELLAKQAGNYKRRPLSSSEHFPGIYDSLTGKTEETNVFARRLRQEEAQAIPGIDAFTPSSTGRLLVLGASDFNEGKITVISSDGFRTLKTEATNEADTATIEALGRLKIITLIYTGPEFKFVTLPRANVIPATIYIMLHNGMLRTGSATLPNTRSILTLTRPAPNEEGSTSHRYVGRLLPYDKQLAANTIDALLSFFQVTVPNQYIIKDEAATKLRTLFRNK